MANRYAGKSKPVRKSVGFTREEWRLLSKFIAKHPKHPSESEVLGRMVMSAWREAMRQESERAAK